MGLAFQCNIKGLKLEYGKFTKELDEAMQVQIRQAARAWLRAVVQRVPVFSGESRASLLPLAGYLRTQIFIRPHRNWLNRKFVGSTSLGVAVGESKGRYEFTAQNYIYTFSFSTDVFQFLVNEFNVGLGSPPLLNETPWHAFDAGEQAFQEYLDKNILSRFIKISDYVVETKNLGL